MAPPPPAPPNYQPAVALTDILGTYRSITSFSSFARLHESTTSLLSSLDSNTTVLAPLNSAVDALPRKPWEEDPRGGAGAVSYEGEDGRERAQRNLRTFVEAHLVARSPWDEGVRATTVAGGGREIWWEDRGAGKRFIMPDGVEVEQVASQVANGEVVRFLNSSTPPSILPDSTQFTDEP